MSDDPNRTEHTRAVTDRLVTAAIAMGLDQALLGARQTAAFVRSNGDEAGAAALEAYALVLSDHVAKSLTS